MADRRIDQFLEGLEARFSSSIAHEEDVAASDLALSLLQGIDLPTALRGKGWALKQQDGASATVVEVGNDYVGVSTSDANELHRLIPLSGAVFVEVQTEPPLSVKRSFVDCLRNQVRRGRRVTVVTRQGLFAGVLSAAASDHLVIRTPTGEVVTAVDAVEEVRLDSPR